MQWLVDKRILLRGAEIKCPSCGLKPWYGVDRISERWTCDGCRQDMPLPLDRQDQLYWKYRINELWATGQDQGTITPLLAIYAMHAKWGSSFAREGFGYYPLIELKERDKDVAKIDIDLVAFSGAKPVLVECKESAGYLNDPQKAEKFAVQLADQVNLAEHIRARKVIIASPSRFPEDKGPLTKLVPNDSQVEIEWWDKDTLLDPLYFTDEAKVNDVERWHLESLANSLRESSER